MKNNSDESNSTNVYIHDDKNDNTHNSDYFEI